MQNLLRTKNLDKILTEAEEPERQLKRALTAKDLTALGIGAIIGAGIFATTGSAAAGGAEHLGAGPAIIISYILVAIACSFCALCYAEFASMIPIAGSAYTYSYATLGELVAWIIGWDLILEYAIGNVAVAISWADYAKTFLSTIKITLPEWITINTQTAYQTIHQAIQSGANQEIVQNAAFGSMAMDIPNWLMTSTQTAIQHFFNPQIAPEILEKGFAMKEIIESAPHIAGIPIVFNFPAILITVIITYILVIGIKESSVFNNIIVLLKLLVIAFVILVGVFYINPTNWKPFAPNGLGGIHAGAAIIFFAYIGFDAVSTAAEETKNPGRDLPLGIMGSLVVCTIVYVLVAAVLTGMLPYKELGVADPMAVAFSKRGITWAAGIISFGAVIAMTAVLLVFQLGQPRIFFSMSRDGLLPAWFAKVHAKYKTPHVATILTGVVVAFCSAFLDINVVVELCNIGTLFAFVLVCAGIMILRHTKPDAKRPFKVPMVPLVPILGILSCVYLMGGLPVVTWVRFGLWLVVGLAIYFMWGIRHSTLRNQVKE